LKPVLIDYQRINGFTPLESSSIYADMVKMESISSLFLPAGRQGGRSQSHAFSNGI
jgi:hypothetical protein